MCLKESCFPDCWKIASVVLLLKNVWEGSKVKNYHSVSHLSEDGKVFEKPLDNRLVDLLEKFGLISDSQHGFRSPQPIADLLTVVSDRTGRPFNRSGAT